MTTQTATHDTEVAQSHTETASSDVRGWAVFVAIGGVLVCLTPLWPVGLCMLGVGCFIFPTTYLVEPVEVAAVTEAEATGGGCGWLVLAGVLILIIALLGLVLLGTVVESGVMG